MYMSWKYMLKYAMIRLSYLMATPRPARVESESKYESKTKTMILTMLFGRGSLWSASFIVHMISYTNTPPPPPPPPPPTTTTTTTSAALTLTCSHPQPPSFQHPMSWAIGHADSSHDQRHRWLSLFSTEDWQQTWTPTRSLLLWIIINIYVIVSLVFSKNAK